MAPRLTVISWRGIPAQVMARDDRRTAKAMLPLRFQVAIDRAATRAGMGKMDAYLGEWRRSERPCGPDLEAEVAAEVAALESRFTKEVVAALVANLGQPPSGMTDPALGGQPEPPRRRGGRAARRGEASDSDPAGRPDPAPEAR